MTSVGKKEQKKHSETVESKVMQCAFPLCNELQITVIAIDCAVVQFLRGIRKLVALVVALLLMLLPLQSFNLKFNTLYFCQQLPNTEVG